MQQPLQNHLRSSAAHDDAGWMYVSTALDFIFLQSSKLTDIELDGRCFRRLDPFFFAWIEHVLSSSSTARQLEGGGDLRLQRALLAPIRGFARARLPRTEVEEARKRLKRTGVYHPPRTTRDACAEVPPGEGAAALPVAHRPAFARTTPEHVAKDLEIILAVASRKGFAREDLFGAGSELAYPLGNDWGLGCFLGGLRIEHIEPGAIILAGPPPRRSRLVWRPREQRRSDLFSQLPR